jgi:hypothetical protein
MPAARFQPAAKRLETLPLVQIYHSIILSVNGNGLKWAKTSAGLAAHRPEAELAMNTAASLASVEYHESGLGTPDKTPEQGDATPRRGVDPMVLLGTLSLMCCSFPVTRAECEQACVEADSAALKLLLILERICSVGTARVN